MLWLSRRNDALYLINESEEILDSVIATRSGFQTAEQVITINSNQSYRYDKVEPHQAVKVDQFDDYYDLDIVIAVYLEIYSEKYGLLKLRSPYCKGGLKGDVVLNWDTK